jgi:hypothetical protein
MRVIMASASCSPAVASRRVKYDGDFRVPTLLGAQPLDAQKNDMAVEPKEGVKLVRGGLQSAPPSAHQDSQANHHA